MSDIAASITPEMATAGARVLLMGVGWESFIAMSGGKRADAEKIAQLIAVGAYTAMRAKAPQDHLTYCNGP